MRQKFFLIGFGLILAAGCRQSTPVVNPPTSTPLPSTPTLISPTSIPSASPSPMLPTLQPTAARPTAVPPWQPPIAPESDMNRPPNTAEIDAADRLLAGSALQRDDIQLAIAYLGLYAPPTPRPLVTEPLPVGARQTLHILNIDNNTIGQIEAELKAVGEHAYFWFDTGAGSQAPDLTTLQNVVYTFDRIYEDEVALFGSENNPGIDGDPRVHVVNVSPLTVCDVTLQTLGNCGLAGYFSAHDTLPTSVDPTSNEREMFVMNGSNFGSSFYLSVLSHEFRHMIEDNYDRGDRDWEVEGSAMLAEKLIGYGDQAIPRANLFLENPDQQLTNWGDGYTLPHYGQGYLFNRYLYARLGEERYRAFAGDPADGFAALDKIAAQSGDESLQGHTLWRDWLASLAIHDHPNVPNRYDLPDNGLRPATARPISSGDKIAETVSQFGADYYRISGQEKVTLNFDGDSLISTMGWLPASGAGMWVADRQNYSQMQLTKAVDLTDLEKATLHYDVAYDIEQGYDFAYVAVSTDGGVVWHGLKAAGMQGDDAADDPANAALTDYFYTGESGGWKREEIDLTPYAGKAILIRFEYVTDPILTHAGIAIDNISLPEIHFYDDAEGIDAGWQAQGFVHTSAYLPQQWELQLVAFPPGQAPQVTPLTAIDGQAAVEIDLPASGGEAILIVAASSPMTLSPASYRLELLP